LTTLVSNIFRSIQKDFPEELIEILVKAEHVKMERIISRGHSSPGNFWYDQDKNEFIILLKGSAGLRFQDTKETILLNPGDYMEIPAHKKHRVEWTDPDVNTVWLAVHY